VTLLRAAQVQSGRRVIYLRGGLMRRYLWLAIGLVGACVPAKAKVATPAAATGPAACAEGDIAAAVFMIDGQPVTCTAAMSLPKERIESVEILKGEAARALYGARGSAGVVMIQTKQPR
jgi:TonB-dependent SusC/RagA subfamily outer membrane receptor